MQKKLLAAAVLSAFSGVAAAQSANVTLYGTLLGDFQFASATGADGGAAPTTLTSSARTTTSYSTNPASQSTRTRMNPAGSNFGLRGTEDLGNGLQAWFQLEISATLGAPSGTPSGQNHGNAPTYRNSAVGLRSATWGSVSVGMWDTPFNVAGYSTMNANGRSGTATVGLLSNTLGALGAIGAGGAYSGQNENAWCAADVNVSNGGCLNAGTNFDRRQKGLLQWWSPNWSGFEARVAYAATNFSDGVTASNRAAGSIKPQIWDLSLAYNNGPLAIGYAYERQVDLLAYTAAVASGNTVLTVTGTGAATVITAAPGNISNGSGTGAWQITGSGAGGVSGSRGVGHRLGGKYAFDLGGGNSIGIGAMWESLKWDLNYAAAVAGDLTQLKKTGWRLQGNFTTGNHFFGLEYARSNKVDGSITSTAASARAFDGSGTKSSAWMLSYNYAFSKRTSLTAYYVGVINDTNSVNSGITFAGIATAAGADPKYYGVNLKHTF
jgi:predicted porin